MTRGKKSDLHAKSIVLYLRFSDDGKPPEFCRRRRLDDVLTTLRMPRRFERENFTSGRRRRAISSSMLKVPKGAVSRNRLQNFQLSEPPSN